jgi:ABC-type glycerol-3-phosphate transport system substrate-binding protein
MKNRSTTALAIVAVSTLVLAGCQQGSTTSGGDDPAGDGAGASGTGGSSSTSLQFQSLSDQPATQAAVQQIVDDWNAENPDTEVTILQSGWDGAYDKLITQFSGGTAPDIIHFDASSIMAFAQDGYLADLTPHISEDVKSSISDGIWGTVTVNDEIIAMPSTMQSYMVFANTDLLEEAGVEVPSGDTMTWDEFMEISRQTTTEDQFGLAWGLASPAATVSNLALGFDGTFFEGEGADATVTIDDGELAVPERIHQMAYDDQSLDPVSLTQSGSEVLPSFYDGKVAMTVQGSFQAANIANDAPEGFNWTVLPPLEGTAGAAQGAGPQTYSINIDSPNVEPAAEFLNFFMKPQHLAEIARADALIPTSSTAREELATMVEGETGWDQILKSGDQLTDAPFLHVDRYADYKDTVMTPALQQYFADDITLDELQEQLSNFGR